jgi:Protein of unknown function (DUF3800)
MKSGGVYVSYLLFLDESGHDHKAAPYEVTGGLALHVSRLWPLVQEMQRLELDAFGVLLAGYRIELKGSKLLSRYRFKWARQADRLSDERRREHCRAFLTKGLQRQSPTRDEFTAYGQACLNMARGVFELLYQLEAKLFATVIPASVVRPQTFQAGEYLRKDHVYLLERFFYFLEAKQKHGLLVVDAADREADRRLARRIERYFTRTLAGRYRAAWIVPVPLFVASDMTYAVQAADLCIYAINWAYRMPAVGMDAPVRREIADEFGRWIGKLKFKGTGYRDGVVYDSHGICYVTEPYRGGKKRGDKYT